MSRFDYFVVFAEMRTGSNFLETNLNAVDGLACHGEAFNPHFIGYPDRTDLLGITRTQREADPASLIDRIKATAGVLGGFRFFNDHDPRVLDICLPDPRCAKVILTRNPVESYDSHRIAAATGQWKLTDARHARSEKVHFDQPSFEAHLERLQAFQIRLLNSLQCSGQTAFYLDYADVQDVAVMNGLAMFLGSASRITALDKKLKKQNPEPLEEKVVNFAAMETALARLDRFNLTRTPNFEPRRGAGIPGFVAAPVSPLLFLPIRSGPDGVIRDWLSALDQGGPLREGFSQKTLRQWKITHPGHRSFAVLRHPLARAHVAFCDRILDTGPDSFPDLRENLRRNFALPLPEGAVDASYDAAAHRAAFLVFLAYLKANLAGQTSMRVDPAWATQFGQIQGFGTVVIPDMIARETNLATDLALLAQQIGRTDSPAIPVVTDPLSARLAAIYDPAIEAAARDAYQRDYVAFGFADWASSA